MNSEATQDLNSAYQRSQQMQGRSTENLEKQRLEYVLKHLFSQMIPSIFYQIQQGREGFLGGKIGLYQYQIKAAPIHPNNGMVGMVYLENLQNGNKQSFVIKPEPKTDEFLSEQKLNPTKAKYIPRILTTFEADNQKWLVCEELKGFHNTKLVQNLSTSLNSEKYAKNVAEMILECAKSGINFRDVSFQTGHNVFATDENVKLVEQGNLEREENLQENEIITERLLQEFESLNLSWLNINNYGERRNSKGEWVKVYEDKKEIENQTKFVFALLCNILPKILIEKLYRRTVRIPMTSLSKEQLFYKVQNYGDSNEQNLQKFEPLWENLNNPKSPLRQRLESFLEKIRRIKGLDELSKLYQSQEGQEFALYSSQSLSSSRFPQEVYDLVLTNNFEGFRKICSEKKLESKISDKKDLAYYGYLYEPIISEEGKNKEIVFRPNPTGWGSISL